MDSIIDFSCRTNPLGMPDFIRERLCAAVSSNGAGYTDGLEELRGALASRHGVRASQAIAAQGVEELLITLVRASGAKSAVVPVPCPACYLSALKRCGVRAIPFQLHRKNNFRVQADELRSALRGADLALVGNPSFPSGGLVRPAELLDCFDDWLYDGKWLIVDESAIDFTYGSVANSIWSGVRRRERAAVIRSLTELLAMPMCPVSYAVGGEAWIRAARSFQYSPCISPLATCLPPLLSGIMPFRAATVDCVRRLMPRFVGRLRHISGMRTLPTDANWVMCRLENPAVAGAAEFARLLEPQGMTVEPCADGHHFTLALKIPIETDRFIKAARAILMPK